MINITINKNDAHQRLDRFLRKYLPGAQLSYIYKAIRKDVKVNGSRAKNDTILEEGDSLQLYISDEMMKKLHPKKNTAKHSVSKRSFGIAYEDDNMLVAVKPQGLLTHGDHKEKKDTLVNQVTDYLIGTGAYIPRIEKTFTPAAVNRLDRNTSGLVIFGKNSTSLRELNDIIKRRDGIEKYYLAIAIGELKENLRLGGKLIKDEARNIVKIDSFSKHSGKEYISSENYNAVYDEDSTSEIGKQIETVVKPLVYRNGFTLVEINLITGRSHQIRAHLAEAGYPLLGDEKYGKALKHVENMDMRGQMLHAYKLKFNDYTKEIFSLNFGEITALPQGRAYEKWKELFPDIEKYISK